MFLLIHNPRKSKTMLPTRCLDSILSLDGTLDTRGKEKQALFLVYNVGSFLMIASSTFSSWFEPRGRYIFTVSSCLSLGAAMIAIALVLCRFKVTVASVVFFSYVYGMTTIIVDFTARAAGNTAWPLLVIVVDFLLVMEVPRGYSMGIVCFAVVYFVVMTLEEYNRFGLLDLPGLMPQSDRYRYLKQTVSCTTLPCPADTVNYQILAVMVFVIDFIITRSFAKGLLKEREAMEGTINAVQEIASLLAGYDVEQVAELLEAHEGDLPAGMAEALRTLEKNLRRYRPYLPAALFEEADDVQHTSIPPPGLDTATATIVFTDIRASTSIWEAAPDGMRAALQIHDSIVREVMGLCGGYEVKTIGDAFMMAFSSVADGVAFGLRVQERLFEAEWPASLLEDAPICSRQGSLWGGLTVRIGVNTGPVTVEQNSLTGRADYFGHTVNVASRLESTCTPGAVAVPSALWSAECGACSAVVGVPEAVYFKGVSGSTMVCSVWPVSLGGRKDSPLCESTNVVEMSLSESIHLFGTLPTAVLTPRASLQQIGTVGVVQLAVGNVTQSTVFENMNGRLDALTIALEQSGGGLVTLLGNCVCVGWNVSRSAPAHMENAIRFVQRVAAKRIVSGAGLASGLVQHGDVGARSQRFVTVMGDVVRRSWALCEDAIRDGVMCLYEPPLDTTLPSTLTHILAPCKGSYRVIETHHRDNVE